MKLVPDLEINRAVRRVLVRHWIDLGKLSIRTASGVTHLSGILDKLPNIPPDLTGAKVAEVMIEIRRINLVRRVDATFLNWVECGITWKPVTPKKNFMVAPGTDPAAPPVIPDLTQAALEIEAQQQTT